MSERGQCGQMRTKLIPSASPANSSAASVCGQNGQNPMGLSALSACPQLTPNTPAGRLSASGSFLIFETEEEAADFEERAAIREYDGGLSRAAAERLAWGDIQAMRLSRPNPSQKAA